MCAELYRKKISKSARKMQKTLDNKIFFRTKESSASYHGVPFFRQIDDEKAVKRTESQDRN